MVKRNQVRIIGGQWRRRLLQFPPAAQLRPTPDRVRETLFNWLGQTLDGKDCLDLFSGSGALGFEAASRGAHRVVMVEHDRLAHASLVANAAMLRADNIELRCEDAWHFLAAEQRRFDIVFLDPPYRQGLLPEVLTRLRDRLSDGAVVYVEAERLPQIPGGYQVARRSQAGQVKYLLLESSVDDHAIQ